MQNTHADTIQTNFHSIASAAGALGVPVSTLRQLKKAGCDGFRSNGNIDLVDVVRWLVTRGQDFKPKRSLEESKALLAEAQAERITNQAAVERGNLCPVEIQQRAISMIVHLLFVCIRQTSQTVPRDFNILLNAVAGIAGYKSLELPAWAIEAIREGTENTFGKDEADFKERAEFFGSVLAGGMETQPK